MKQPRPIIIALIALICSINASFGAQESVVSAEEEVANITLKPAFVFKRGIDRRRHARLIKSVKRVYPLAKVAQEKMRGMEDHLATLSTRRAKKEYIRKIYREIKEEYTPILMKMTMSDGRVLIRLIDRETDYTAYEVLDEFKGGFTAIMWQGVGRLFGQNLKDEYGSSKEDEMIERIIKLYEAGLL